MSDSTSTEFGLLKLFDFDGNEIKASREDLLSIEGMSHDKALHRRVVGNRSGRYWLVSDRPGFQAMLLEVSIFHCHPRDGDEWSISYCLSGIANYPHFNLETAIAMFQEVGWNADSDDGKPLPQNVADLARKHVAYRLGKEHGDNPLDVHGIRVKDAVDIRAQFNQFAEGSVDPSELIKMVAGRGRVAIFELLLAVATFCGQHKLDDQLDEILLLLVPDDQHERLEMLVTMLNQQSGSEDANADEA